MQDRTRHDNNKAIQSNLRQDKTRLCKHKPRQCNTNINNTKQDDKRQYKTRHDEIRRYKTRQYKTKTIQYKQDPNTRH